MIFWVFSKRFNKWVGGKKKHLILIEKSVDMLIEKGFENIKVEHNFIDITATKGKKTFAIECGQTSSLKFHTHFYDYAMWIGYSGVIKIYDKNTVPDRFDVIQRENKEIVIYGWLNGKRWEDVKWIVEKYDILEEFRGKEYYERKNNHRRMD